MTDRDKSQPFIESCCDGGGSTTHESTQPCGCDPGYKWKNGGTGYYCKEHRDGVEWKPKTQLISEIRHFESGATRNLDTNKHDYEGFLNPSALYEFGKYMHEHRHQRDGSLRDSDNWQKGISFRVYVKSLVRHTIDLWRMERGYAVTNPDTGQPHTKIELCCAIVFNAMGYLKELVDPAPINKETV